MTDNMARAHALVIAMATVTQVKMEGMKVANAERETRGEAQAYPEDAFVALIEESGVYWNNVVGMLNEAMP